MLALVIAMVAMGTVVAFAEETDSNMTSDFFLEIRMAQIEKALDEGLITEEQAAELIDHINGRALEGTFGLRGTNEDCDLDEELQGFFRNENSGMRNGQGSGVRANDGTGQRKGGNGQSKGGQGAGGQGLRDGSCL